MVKKLSPFHIRGRTGAPPYLVISKNEILGVFRPFIQRSLPSCSQIVDFEVTKAMSLYAIGLQVDLIGGAFFLNINSFFDWHGVLQNLRSSQ